jgi:hypothetical protein
LGAKAFDYIVYPSGLRPCLVDVKGRKIAASPRNPDARSKNWVTRADLEGLQAWQEVFGRDYQAAFVFGFWLAGHADLPTAAQGEASTMVETFAGRHYSFWVAPAEDYARLHRQLSRRWKTVNIPTDDFRRISRPLQSSWPSAPC